MSNVTRATRQDQARKREWKDPNELDVPEAVKERLNSEGFGLRWIRVIEPETHLPDVKNVYARHREGYEFVTPEDVPEWKFVPGYEVGKFGTLIVVGDLALAKLPLEIDASRKREMRNRTNQLTQAIERELYENKQLNDKLPIDNRSRSQAIVGGGKRLEADE